MRSKNWQKGVNTSYHDSFFSKNYKYFNLENISRKRTPPKNIENIFSYVYHICYTLSFSLVYSLDAEQRIIIRFRNITNSLKLSSFILQYSSEENFLAKWHDMQNKIVQYTIQSTLIEIYRSSNSLIYIFCFVYILMLSFRM